MSIVLTTMIISCNSNDDTPQENSTEKINGRYLIMSSAEKIATGDAYLSLYDSVPTGDIKNVVENTTQVDAYGRFVVVDNKWAFKKFKFTGETGIVRYSLGTNGELVIDGFISAASAVAYFIVDETTGFYGDSYLSALGVQTFNPKTMARTGQIDVSSLFNDEDFANYDIAVASSTLVASGGKLFANVSYTVKVDAAEGTVIPHFTMVVIDIESSTAEKLIVHEDEIYSQGHGARTEYTALQLTEDGTIYMSTHGLYDKDADGNKPKSAIFRINNGETDFDQDWILTGSDILGGGDDDRKMVWSMYYKNDKLYVDCSDNSIEANFSNLLSNMYNVYAVDTETKEAIKITGAPNTIFGHADGNLFDVNDELYIQIKNDDEGSGYYKINTDNTATKVFNITDTYPRAIGYLEIQE